MKPTRKGRLNLGWLHKSSCEWLLVEQMLRRWPPWVRILFVGVLWKRTSAAPATLELTLLLTGCCSFGPGGCQGGEVGGWWPGGQVQGPGPQGWRQTRRSPGGSRTHGGHRGCRRRRRFHLKISGRGNHRLSPPDTALEFLRTLLFFYLRSRTSQTGKMRTSFH